MGVLLEAVLLVENGGEGLEGVLDVAGGAPTVGEFRGPGGGVLHAPLAHGEVDWVGVG